MCRTVKGCYGYADVGGYMCEKKRRAQQQKKKGGKTMYQNILLLRSYETNASQLELFLSFTHCF